MDFWLCCKDFTQLGKKRRINYLFIALLWGFEGVEYCGKMIDEVLDKFKTAVECSGAFPTATNCH
jgi:hypothetical protein